MVVVVGDGVAVVVSWILSHNKKSFCSFIISGGILYLREWGKTKDWGKRIHNEHQQQIRWQWRCRKWIKYISKQDIYYLKDAVSCGIA